MDHTTVYTTVVGLQGALSLRLTDCCHAVCGPNSSQPSFREAGLADPDLSLADMRNPRAEKGVVPDSRHQARPRPKRKNRGAATQQGTTGARSVPHDTPRALAIDPAGWQA